MATLGAGDVPLELGGDTLILRPTLRAAQAISRQSGGIGEAVNRVGRLDLDMIAFVIASGLGRSGTKAVDDIAEKVYAVGVPTVIEAVVRYLVILANGGKPPAEGPTPGDENPPNS